MAAALRDRNAGLPVVGERQSLEHYLTSWLETTTPTIRPQPWKHYAEYVNLHISPVLGKVALSRLTPQHVQQLYAAKLTEGLSSTTVAHLHAVLYRALQAAVRLGLVQRNVTTLVDRQRMHHHEMSVLTPEQVHMFLDAAKGDRLEALYVLALSTGMRQGELLALRWRDLDLDNPTLQIRGTLQRTTNGLIIADQKHRAAADAWRSVRLPWQRYAHIGYSNLTSA